MDPGQLGFLLFFPHRRCHPLYQDVKEAVLCLTQRSRLRHPSAPGPACSKSIYPLFIYIRLCLRALWPWTLRVPPLPHQQPRETGSPISDVDPREPQLGTCFPRIGNWSSDLLTGNYSGIRDSADPQRDPRLVIRMHACNSSTWETERQQGFESEANLS